MTVMIVLETTIDVGLYKGGVCTVDKVQFILSSKPQHKGMMGPLISPPSYNECMFGRKGFERQYMSGYVNSHALFKRIHQ